MEDRSDFTTTLRALMARSRRSNSDLAQLTGISTSTIENWTTGIVRRPRSVADLLKLARVLALDAADTTTLLTAAGHPSLATLHAQAEQTGDRALAALLDTWPLAAARDPASAASLPVASLHAARYQLRAPVADFVGRAREIDELVTGFRRALAEQGGAIIRGVQGMGGIGKTELAYAIAHQLRDAFPDAQLVLNLRGSSATPLTPEQTLHAVIHILSPDAKLPDELPALKQHYRTRLHGARMLILADDARDAAQVQGLLPPTGSAVLITSRQRFNLPGMTPIHLRQLGEDEAVALLRAICPRLDEEEAFLIAQACGHLPLALRIGGGILHSTPALPVATYLAQLGDERQRLRALRDPDDGQLDVEASLALSYAQLDEAAQQVFRQLGVLVADFATTLAQAVVDAHEGVEVEATLQLLLRRNLVLYDAEHARWRLHDLVRDLARGYLEAADEADATWWRYAHAAVQIEQDLHEQYLAGGDGVRASLARFDAERAHIDAARWWAATGAGMPHSEQLLLDDAAVMYEIGALRYDVRRERIPHWERALAAAQRLGDQHAEAQVLRNLGIGYLHLGDAEQAIPYCIQALTIARAIGDRRGESRTLGNLGNAYAMLGEIRDAIPYYEQSLTIARALGDRRHEGNTLSNLGNTYFMLGEARRAIPYYEQALTIFCELGDQRHESIALDNLGRAYTHLGEALHAIEFYERVLTIAHAIGDRRIEGYALGDLELNYVQLGDLGRAIEACERSLTIAREIGDQRMEGYTLSYLAHARAYHGNLAHAITAFEQALTIMHVMGDRWGEAECQWLFGLALAQQGERDQALPLLRAAVAYEQEIGHAKAAGHTALITRLEAGEELPLGQRAVGTDGDASPHVT